MNIEDFNEVASLIGTRKELLQQIDQVLLNGLGVTINGRYQDDDMLRVVRPLVVKELQKRIVDIDVSLSRLGVT